jgi:hypothetical protein
MGLTVSNTTVTALGQRFVTKADTASSKSLGSATVPSDSGVAGTLGTWTEIITSTAAESYITAVGIVLTSGINATDFPVFIELGTGAAASEVVKWASVAAPCGDDCHAGVHHAPDSTVPRDGQQAGGRTGIGQLHRQPQLHGPRVRPPDQPDGG